MYRSTVEGTVSVWIVPGKGKAMLPCHSMSVLEFSNTSFVYVRILYVQLLRVKRPPAVHALPRAHAYNPRV